MTFKIENRNERNDFFEIGTALVKTVFFVIALRYKDFCFCNICKLVAEAIFVNKLFMLNINIYYP